MSLPPWRASSFLLGMFLIWMAIGSPLAALDEQFLTVHMLQHLLLMTVAPALILLGAPVMPLMHGLPRYFMRSVLAPLFRRTPVRLLGRLVSQPAFCWIAAAAALVGWHIPAAFTLGLQSESWHVVEHACFLGAGFLFWWPVVQPWPGIPVWPRWSILVYLFLATLPVRHPLRVPGILRPRCLSRVLLGAPPFRHVRSRRPTVRGCPHVGLHHYPLSGARGDSDDGAAGSTRSAFEWPAAIGTAPGDGSLERSAKRGGWLGLPVSPFLCDPPKPSFSRPSAVGETASAYPRSLLRPV